MTDTALDRFLRIARRAELDLDVRDILDAAWLATHLPAPQKSTEIKPDPVGVTEPLSASHGDVPAKTEGAPTESIASTSTTESAPTGLAAPAPGAVARGAGAVAVRVPGAPALPKPGALGRALRPLHRRVAVTRERELDLGASIDRYAETRVWVPQWRRARGPWLEVALVVDVGRSMDVWRRTALEAHRALERSGVFRAVSLWSLDTEAQGAPVLRSGLRLQGPSRGAKELVDPFGLRAVLVLSDCVSRAWHDGGAAKLLRTWAIAQSVAVLQVLPRAWWVRTGLRHHCDVTLRTSAPATPSAKLVSDGETLDGDLGVPVVTLGEVGLGAWSQLAIGRVAARLHGVLIEREFQAFGSDEPAASEASGASRVEGFRRVASRPAWRMALACAAAPVVTLPILRILRSALVPEADTQHVAELLLGGLLREVDAGTRSADPDAVIYEVPDEVRRSLAGEVSLATTAEVLRRVTGFIERERGASVDFRAVVRGDSEALRGDLPMGKVFASATPDVLRALGVTASAPTSTPAPAPKPEPLRVLVLCSRSLEREREFRAVLTAFGERAADLGWFLLMRLENELEAVLVSAFSSRPSSRDPDGSMRGKHVEVGSDQTQTLLRAFSECVTADAAVFFTGPKEGAPPTRDDVRLSSNLASLAEFAGIPLIVAPDWGERDLRVTFRSPIGSDAIRALGPRWRRDPSALVEAIAQTVQQRGRRDRSALPPPSMFNDDEVRLSRAICVIRDAQGRVKGTGVIANKNVVMMSLNEMPSGAQTWTANFVVPFGAGCVQLSLPLGDADQRITFARDGITAWSIENTVPQLAELARPPSWKSLPPNSDFKLAWFSEEQNRVMVRPAMWRTDYFEPPSDARGPSLDGAVLLDARELTAVAMLTGFARYGAPEVASFERIAQEVSASTSSKADPLRSVFALRRGPPAE